VRHELGELAVDHDVILAHLLLQQNRVQLVRVAQVRQHQRQALAFLDR
jgi:hypothetical protein